jgi:hypothetical protein
VVVEKNNIVRQRLRQAATLDVKLSSEKAAELEASEKILFEFDGFMKKQRQKVRLENLVTRNKRNLKKRKYKQLEKSRVFDPSKPTEVCCGVCGDGACVDDNEILYCDGCNMALHQQCYGVSVVPEGDWKCERCVYGSTNKFDLKCAICSRTGGIIPVPQT